MVHGLVMFSGGLDSVTATHLLRNQGLKIKALHFVLPFYSGLGSSYKEVRRYADALGVPIRIEEEGEEFLDMILDPAFGYGKNANPCMDCRIARLKKAAKIMEEEGASFIATGEVIGQRPMSQRLECLYTVEKKANLQGILLRPLSARLLPPTKVEEQGLVDRERLLAISGRSRKVQLEYAREHGLIHATPAGGCLLTHADPARRFNELVSHNQKISLNDFKLLAWGRHFRLSPLCKIIVSRNESENGILEKIVTAEDYFMFMAEIPGPVAILRGICTDDEISVAASVLVRFSKARNSGTVKVKVFHKENTFIREVESANDQYCQAIRI
ncbi:MAG: tRNA 4-thiouridine(8) synthase ThiI [Fibrobacter sp.]|jgi:tRNA-specific 2-thiouridylase|nr:tRNA 4-thiouridine(8) synthase ThiI [Fibrobacter sp.]